MTEFDHVVAALHATIENPEKWHDALALLCRACRAKKAIIALRDNRTANFIVPTRVQEQHNSPLLYGFSEEEVGSFVCHFKNFDPWTQYEKAFRPYTPFALSKYIAYDSLKETPFWEWLEPQGISDTVVAEIGHGNGHWAAINLYFENKSGRAADRVLQLFSAYLEPLKRVWAIGRSVQLAKIESQNRSPLIAHIDRPAIVTDKDLRVQSYNSAAEKLVASGAITRLEFGSPPVFSRQVAPRLDTSATAAESLFDQRNADDSIYEEAYSAVGTLLHQTEAVSGETHQGWLFLIIPKAAPDRHLEKPVWENGSLTPQESVLARILAEGGKLVEFQRIQGISKPRSAQISKSLKTKLGVSELSEIRTIHQLYLSKTYTEL